MEAPTLFDIIKKYVAVGMTFDEAIEKVEGILRIELPENIKALARQECK